jgi:hypothetical protein
MHSIDEVKREDVRRLLSAYSDAIGKVFAGRREIVLQWKTRKDYKVHGHCLDRMLKSLGFVFMTHRKGEIQIAYSEVRHGLLHIFTP